MCILPLIACGGEPSLYDVHTGHVGGGPVMEVWSEAVTILSSSPLMGHALMAALLCQQLASSDGDAVSYTIRKGQVCACN